MNNKKDRVKKLISNTEDLYEFLEKDLMRLNKQYAQHKENNKLFFKTIGSYLLFYIIAYTLYFLNLINVIGVTIVEITIVITHIYVWFFVLTKRKKSTPCKSI